jgi:hypothetical protein
MILYKGANISKEIVASVQRTEYLFLELVVVTQLKPLALIEF